MLKLFEVNDSQIIANGEFSTIKENDCYLDSQLLITLKELKNGISFDIGILEIDIISNIDALDYYICSELFPEELIELITFSNHKLKDDYFRKWDENIMYVKNFNIENSFNNQEIILEIIRNLYFIIWNFSGMHVNTLFFKKDNNEKLLNIYETLNYKKIVDNNCEKTTEYFYLKL